MPYKNLSKKSFKEVLSHYSFKKWKCLWAQEAPSEHMDDARFPFFKGIMRENFFKTLFATYLALLALTSCVHRPPPRHGDTLFPIGTFKHSLLVKVEDKPPYPASGVLAQDTQSLKVFLLGPMNVTAAKITETFSDESVKIENHIPQLEDYEDYILSFYEVLRSFVLYPRHEDKWGNLYVTEHDANGLPTVFVGPYKIHFIITEYKNNHPIKFRIVHPKFTASVEETP